MNPTTPKILLIIPNLGRGGAQRVFHQQRVKLSSSADLYACVFNWNGAFPEERSSSIYSLEVPEGRSFVQKALNFLLRIRRLKALKRKLGIDISISHLEGADYINIFSRRTDKVICWVHGTKKFDRNINGILGFFRRKLLMPITYTKSDYIVTVSNGIRHELLTDFKIPPPRIATIYNGFDLQTIIDQSKDELPESHKRIYSGSPVIITHCRLAVQKNLHALIHVFKRLKENRPVKLVILGDGEERESLLRTCKLVNLNAYTVWETAEINSQFDIYFLGYISQPYKWLFNANLYVMTSDWEGFPLSLCEAMACGLPVVSTDCFTGPKEILAPELNDDIVIEKPLQGEYGILMPLIRDDRSTMLELWVNTIDEFLHDEGLRRRYSKKGFVRISQLNLENSMDDLWRIIQSLL